MLCLTLEPAQWGWAGGASKPSGGVGGWGAHQRTQLEKHLDWVWLLCQGEAVRKSQDPGNTLTLNTLIMCTSAARKHL